MKLPKHHLFNQITDCERQEVKLDTAQTHVSGNRAVRFEKDTRMSEITNNKDTELFFKQMTGL